MGMFKRRKSKSDSSETESIGGPSPSNSAQTYPAYGSYDNNNQTPLSPDRSAASAPTVNGMKKKKKGLGSKLKGLVSNSRRRSFSDNKSVSSAYSQDSQQHPEPPPKLKRKLQTTFPQEESSSFDSYSSSEDQFRNPLGTVAEVNEDDYDSDGELRVKPRQQSSSQMQPLRNGVTPSKTTQRLGGGGDGAQFAETISIVILLVDPNSKRFELLQFQQNRPKNIKIKTVLKQLQGKMTEPELKSLKVVGLMDKQGFVYKSNAYLSQAIGEATKEILVGVVQGMEETTPLLQSVRPILGDPKMGNLLDINGFHTKGWVKKKKTKASILDKKPPSRVQVEKQGSLLSVLGFLLVVGSLVYGVDKLLVHLDSQGAFVQPLPDWPTVVEHAGDAVLEGVQAAKEAILEGNRTAIQAMANSTYAAVEETAMEAVHDIRELGFSFDKSQPPFMLHSAKDMVLMAAVPAAKVIAEAKTNVSASLANATTNLANVTDGILANATKAIQQQQRGGTSTPNSIWEDYVLIGLLVCWLLYWMAI